MSVRTPTRRVVGLVVGIVVLANLRLTGQTRPPLQVVVEDETRAVIVGAKLTLTNAATEQARDAATDESGRVAFDDLEPGQYVLHAASAGFQALTRPIAISTQPLPVVKLTLRVEVVTEDVSVTAARAPRESPETVVLDRDALDRLPVALGPGQLTEFLANVFGPAVQGIGGVTFVVDGIETDELSLPSLSIKSIVVNKNPYSAEYRRPGKARVEVITENGSRRHFAWNSTLLLGNSMLDARNAFAREKPQTSQTLIDSGFGGPLPGRTAFLVSGEYLRDRQSRYVNALTSGGPFIQTVPKTDESANWLGRLDARLSDLVRLMVRYDFAGESKTGSGVGGLRLPTLAVDTVQTQHGVHLKADSLFSASFANDVRVSFERGTDHEGSPASKSKNIVRGAFEGGSNQTFTSERSNELQLQDTATYVRGSHMLRFGGQSQARSHRATDRANFGGTFEFSTLELFDAGVPSVFRINQGQADVDFTVYDANLFFQDEVKVGPAVTLMAGARYDWQSALDDHDNVAPRVAFSLAPGDATTVIRGGGGLFYERLPESVVQRTRLFDGTRTRELVIANSPYPNPFAAGSGRLTPPSVVRLGPDLRTPYYLQASLGVERRVWRQKTRSRTPRELIVTAEFAPLHGSNLFRVRNVNAPRPGTGGRPDPDVLNVAQVESTATLRSNALKFGLTGRAWRFRGTVNYTYAHSTNDVGGSLFRFPADNYNLAGEWGRADFDTRHKFNTLATFNLPGDGIELGTFVTLASGPPFDITTGFDDNGDTEATDRPAGVTRNTGKGPGFAQVDLRLWKKVKLGPGLGGAAEPRELIIRLDAFNVLNRPNYDRIVGVVSSPLFGLPNSARTPRSIQASLRFRF